MFAIPIGDPKSIIDYENERIILRQRDWPKNGRYEWVISGDIIQENQVKRKGIVTEMIQISEISKIELYMPKHHSGDLMVGGLIPKLWHRGVPFNGADVFVAHAAYMYILAKRQGDLLNPLKTKISPLPLELRGLLDSGTIDQEELKRKGISF